MNLFNVEFSIWKSKFTKQELLESFENGDIYSLLTYFFSKETQFNEKEYCFIKEIKAYEFYPFLKVYFKNSKFLYQVKDPRDMALSWKKNTTHKGGVIEASEKSKVDQQQFLKIAELEKLSNSIVFVKYEDLVSNAEEVETKALAVFGLNYEINMLDMNKDKLTAQNAKAQKAWQNLSKPVMKDNVDKFKKELTSDEIKYIESICYSEMKYFGYETMFGWDSLKEIHAREIQSHHNLEMKQLSYQQAKGVKENMKAKQFFYQHTN